MLDVLNGLAISVLCYQGAAALLSFLIVFPRTRRVGLIADEGFRWGAWPTCAAYWAHALWLISHGSYGAAVPSVLLGALVAWFASRGDDGRWKRLRRRVTSRVAVQGHRLTVVPTAAP